MRAEKIAIKIRNIEMDGQQELLVRDWFVGLMASRQSEGSFEGDILVDVIHAVLVLAVIVFAASHEVEKAGHVDIHLFLVGKPASFVWKLALAHGVEDAGFFAEVVGKPALVALGAVVFVVEFAADVFVGFGLDDLSFDGVGKKAVEAVLAVAHVEVDARVEAAIGVVFAVLAGSLLPVGAGALVDCKVLIGTEVLDIFQLVF